MTILCQQDKCLCICGTLESLSSLTTMPSLHVRTASYLFTHNTRLRVCTLNRRCDEMPVHVHTKFLNPKFSAEGLSINYTKNLHLLKFPAIRYLYKCSCVCLCICLHTPLWFCVYLFPPLSHLQPMKDWVLFLIVSAFVALDVVFLVIVTVDLWRLRLQRKLLDSNKVRFSDSTMSCSRPVCSNVCVKIM